MRRSPCRLLCLLALALAASAGSQAQAKSGPSDFFPLRLNDWWKYRSTQANGTASEFTLTVKAERKEPDGTILHCVELANPKPLIHDWYEKTPKAVLLVQEEYLGGGGKVTLDPARPLLALPLRGGARWNWSGQVRGSLRVEEENEAFPSEKIETAAGRFDAVRVVTKIEQGGAQATKTSWFAPGVGLVRQATDSSGITSTTELIDYSFKRKR